MMRLIDADELIAQMETDAEHMDDPLLKMFYCAAIHDIKHAPTIEPELNWTPCSERLPEEKDAGILKKLGTKKRSEYVIATVEVKGERMTVTACTYDGKWDWKMKYAFPDFKVVAWMPLPPPYQPTPHCTNDYCEIEEE